MRLLNVFTESLEDFRDGEAPAYAILSHTWLYPVSREVNYQDLELSRSYRRKDGYMKVRFACDKARVDGLSYVWIDTCCINNLDPLEVGKAINSMYRWYQNSSVCYADLGDVVLPEELRGSYHLDFYEAFSRCRWFTRGWTLQEMIAPRSVKFYDRKGTYLGDRHRLAFAISRVTGIDIVVLRDTKIGRKDILDTFSMAQRLAWASTRKTTEPEDIAYCIVGIVGVYLSPQYGEGLDGAFKRLQLEIIRVTADQSIFAWTGDHSGLLAPSPAVYNNSRHIVSLPVSITDQDLITGGVRVSADLINLNNMRQRVCNHGSASHIMLLNCQYTDEQRYVPGLLLQSILLKSVHGDEIFHVVGGPNRMHRVKKSDLGKMIQSSKTIILMNDAPPQPEGVVLRAMSWGPKPRLEVVDVSPKDSWPITNVQQYLADAEQSCLAHYFKHSVLLRTRVVAGLRVRRERKTLFDIVFESDRAERAFRLLAVKLVRGDRTIGEVCSDIRELHSRPTSPWMLWHGMSGDREGTLVKGRSIVLPESSLRTVVMEINGTITFLDVVGKKPESLHRKKKSGFVETITKEVNKLFL